MQKIIVLVFIFIFSLHVQAAPPVSVVSRVEAEYQRKTYQYTKPQKMAIVLTGLRLLKYKGTPSLDPEAQVGDICRITVMLTDGQCHRYYLHTAGFLSKDHKPWIRVDPELLLRLCALFRHLPPE